MGKSKKVVISITAVVLVVALLAGGWSFYSQYRAAHTLTARQRDQVVDTAIAYVRTRGTHGTYYSDASEPTLLKIVDNVGYSPSDEKFSKSTVGTSVSGVKVSVPGDVDPTKPFDVTARFTSTAQRLTNPGKDNNLFILEAANSQEQVTLKVESQRKGFVVSGVSTAPADRWAFEQKAVVPAGEWKKAGTANEMSRYPEASRRASLLFDFPHSATTFKAISLDFPTDKSSDSDLTGSRIAVSRLIPCSAASDQAKIAAAEKKSEADFKAWLAQKAMLYDVQTSWLKISYADVFNPCALNSAEATR